jgi:hypothetical protein
MAIQSAICWVSKVSGVDDINWAIIQQQDTNKVNFEEQA